MYFRMLHLYFTVFYRDMLLQKIINWTSDICTTRNLFATLNGNGHCRNKSCTSVSSNLHWNIAFEKFHQQTIQNTSIFFPRSNLIFFLTFWKYPIIPCFESYVILRKIEMFLHFQLQTVYRSTSLALNEVDSRRKYLYFVLGPEIHTCEFSLGVKCVGYN